MIEHVLMEYYYIKNHFLPVLQRLHRNRDVHGAQLTIIAYVSCPHFQLVQIGNRDDIVTGEDGLLGLDWKSSAHGSWQGEMLWMRRRNWHRRRSADGHLNIGSGDRPQLEKVEVHEVEKGSITNGTPPAHNRTPSHGRDGNSSAPHNTKACIREVLAQSL
jgi:hypothetical protein